MRDIKKIPTIKSIVTGKILLGSMVLKPPEFSQGQVKFNCDKRYFSCDRNA